MLVLDNPEPGPIPRYFFKCKLQTMIATYVLAFSFGLSLGIFVGMLIVAKMIQE